MQELYNFFHEIGKLKKTYRFSQNKYTGVSDSSADHSWRVAVMAFMLAEELKLGLDVAHALKLALVHDLPEALNGDVDARLLHLGKVTKEEKLNKEKAAIIEITKGLGSNQVRELWHEYEHGQSEEARFIKAIDKIEGLMQLHESGPQAFDYPGLLGTYGNRAVSNFPALLPVFRMLKAELKDDCNKAGFEWKENYDL
jgi:putative hydrolase of HD superfamily